MRNGKPHLRDETLKLGSGNGNRSGPLKRQPTGEGWKGMQAHSSDRMGGSEPKTVNRICRDEAAKAGSGNGNRSGHLKRQPTEEGLKSKCKLHCSDGMSGSK
jgi:hypothetical protein